MRNVNGTLTITGRLSDPAYDGTIIHAEQLAGSIPGTGSGPEQTTFHTGPLSGYLTGTGGFALPLTIVDSGINTSSYAPLSSLLPANPGATIPLTGGETE